MKRYVVFWLLAFAALSQPLSSSSVSDSEKEELKQIVTELKNLNEEQNEIIQNSKKRNEELETLSKKQEKQIESLTELSESRQTIIQEQKKTIEELESLSKERKKSSLRTALSSIFAAIASFFIGCFAGFFLL